MYDHNAIDRDSDLSEKRVHFDFGTLTGAAAQDREILLACDQIEVTEVYGQFTGLGGSTNVKAGAYVYNGATPDTQAVEDPSVTGTLAMETAVRASAGRIRNRPTNPARFAAAVNSSSDFGEKSVLLKLRATVSGAGSPTRFSGYIGYRLLRGRECRY